jgi:hypothetical protein
MIEALKALGFEGNMFVATRAQALKTCEEILQLNIDIKMQIIVMYLSSQVARLRRFLDGERQWDDYPVRASNIFPAFSFANFFCLFVCFQADLISASSPIVFHDFCMHSLVDD